VRKRSRTDHAPINADGSAPRGIEHGCLERLFEAVHVDQDVASAAGLREKIADLSGHRFDPINAASDRRLSPGGTSFARATIIVEARSGPNQGFARRPFTGLRVVATSNVGSTDSADASKRGAVAPKSAHPPSASTQPEHANRQEARGGTQ
jgi:hypothetical protein